MWLFFGPASEGPVLAVGTPPTITAGGSIAQPSASFTDASPQGGHSCTIDWGDGTTPDAIGTCDPAALAAASHPYPAIGRYLVRVRVTNDYGASSESVTALAVE